MDERERRGRHGSVHGLTEQASHLRRVRAGPVNGTWRKHGATGQRWSATTTRAGARSPDPSRHTLFPPSCSPHFSGTGSAGSFTGVLGRTLRPDAISQPTVVARNGRPGESHARRAHEGTAGLEERREPDLNAEVRTKQLLGVLRVERFHPAPTPATRRGRLDMNARGRVGTPSGAARPRS